MLQEHTHHLPVNWFDGMNINKTHFIAMDNHFNEMLIDNAGQRINKNNYGLLPDNANKKLIKIDIDSHQVLHVIIKNLRAVTLSGARIEITDDTIPLLELTCKMNSFLPENANDNQLKLSVIIRIDPFARNPWGNADPEEIPPRKPNILPDYSIHIIPLKELENTEIGLYHITIGQLTLNNGVFSANPSYIPPCTSIESYPGLVDLFLNTLRNLNDLEIYTIKIIQKVRGKNQQNALAITLCDIAEKILFYISSQIPSFRLDLKYQPPIYLFEKIIILARITHTTLNTWQGNGKEELMTYLSDWCNLNEGIFEAIVTDLATLTYTHHDMAEAINKTEKFMQIMIPLFRILSELDYIGKSIDSHIFVAEDNSLFEAKPETLEAKRNWFKKL